MNKLLFLLVFGLLFGGCTTNHKYVVVVTPEGTAITTLSQQNQGDQQNASFHGYPDDMWKFDPNDPSGKNRSKSDSKSADIGITVDNYRSVEWIGKLPHYELKNKAGVVVRSIDCTTGNWGHDAQCLKKEAQKLNGFQVDCVAERIPCNPDFNFGIWARRYLNLADKLDYAQKYR